MHEAMAGEPPLTAREREVARLVSQGLSNREIGHRLVITEGTANVHVKHILRKLGLRSRAQLIVWVLRTDIDHGTGA
jgi:DNA-binding CsgD family transcriptional regulator